MPEVRIPTTAGEELVIREPSTLALSEAVVVPFLRKPRYYRRDGTAYEEPDACLKWAVDFENRGYKIVKQQVLKNGLFVSTVWLGLDHGWGGPLEIFETMVFPKKGSGDDLDMERYATEAEAIAGHERMVTQWKGSDE